MIPGSPSAHAWLSANNNGKIPRDADMLKIGRDMLMPGQPGPATVGGAPVGPSTGSKSSANASQGEESPTAKYEAYLKQNDYPVTPANIKALQDQDAKKKAAQ